MELFGISLVQYLVIIASMLLVYFIMKRAEFQETVDSFSSMMQLMEQWLNEPREITIAQHDKAVRTHLRHLWDKKHLRFTIIRADGVVLLDGATDHKTMDNHLSRPEIQDALTYGRGVAVRYSDSIKGPMIYVAEPIKTEWGTLYLRLAAEPEIIEHGSLSYVIMAIIAVTGVILVKL